MQIIAFKKPMNGSNSISCSGIVSPENSLKVALSRIQKTRAARVIFIAWPSLEGACKMLARMITHNVPASIGSDEFLLDKALSQAIQAYEEASVHALREEELTMAFTKALFNVGGEVVKLDVHIVSDGETMWWEPYSVPLHDFIKKNKAVTMFCNSAPDNSENVLQASRMKMASHLCSVQTLARLGIAPNAIQGCAA